MKRFISVLLVALLIVTSMATVAFAVNANPGETKSLSITVTGSFAGFRAQMSAQPGLTIVGFEGPVVGNPGNGKVNFTSGVNVESVTFNVLVKVADNIAPGTYYVSGAIEKATFVNENGELVPASVSISGNSVTITCTHAWSDWTIVKEATCTEEGLKTRTCSLCGETESVAIAKIPHAWSTAWNYDEDEHWHVCSVCGEHSTHEDHFHQWVVQQPNVETQEDGWKQLVCVCGHRYPKEIIPWDTDPEGGDMTYDVSVVAYGVVAMISMVASAAFVTKRKSV